MNLVNTAEKNKCEAILIMLQYHYIIRDLEGRLTIVNKPLSLTTT